MSDELRVLMFDVADQTVGLKRDHGFLFLRPWIFESKH